MSWYGGFKPYVPVAKRRAQAARYATQLAKKEKRTLCPVKIEGRKITQSFWGQAWCENLERYSDFENRLPRGRTYVRNGSVIDLQIGAGKVTALVSGSEVYRITITIQTLAKPAWKRIKQDCSQSIDSLIDLLQGRFEQGIMQRLTERETGLFPQPKEIGMKCSCPDGAYMCKHLAAVLYGIGARLDTAPELLFTLREVDHLELISQAVAAENLDQTLGAGQTDALAGQDLGDLFGIELDANSSNTAPNAPRRKPAARKRGSAAAEGEPKPRSVRRAKVQAELQPTAEAPVTAKPRGKRRGRLATASRNG